MAWLLSVQIINILFPPLVLRAWLNQCVSLVSF